MARRNRADKHPTRTLTSQPQVAHIAADMSELKRPLDTCRSVLSDGVLVVDQIG